MAKTTTTADSELLDFVQKHYNELKAEAEADNTDDTTSTQAEIKKVIELIDVLFATINKADVTHEKIVEQLKALRDAYDSLKLNDTDAAYTRYKNAFESLNMIVGGLEKDEP